MNNPHPKQTLRGDAEIQREYYDRTAQQYDKMHVRENDEHFLALKYVSGFLNLHNLSSVLDVGCGTGRALNFLMHRNPDVTLHGVEPVPSLVRQAIERNSIPPKMITVGNGVQFFFLTKTGLRMARRFRAGASSPFKRLVFSVPCIVSKRLVRGIVFLKAMDWPIRTACTTRLKCCLPGPIEFF
jgi:SAM-dependent methyltransferase